MRVALGQESEAMPSLEGFIARTRGSQMNRSSRMWFKIRSE